MAEKSIRWAFDARIARGFFGQFAMEIRVRSATVD
jgi:hypothetical protein